MPREIHHLDNLTANQIAAGEVIERPVSVVKELIENAIDSECHKIDIRIEAGGLELIQIRDDGKGMSPEDLPLSIERHATSKLKIIDDLDHLETLGFRGEALASIASVSKMTLISRGSFESKGYRMKIEGEKVIEPLSVTGAPTGTTIIVEALFFNTPARLKFMKSSGYEAGLIHELVIQMALGYPHIDFRLENEQKCVVDTAGISRTEDLIELFYGKEARSHLLIAEEAIDQGRVQAFFTAPPFSRGSRKGIHLFINGRRVKAKELQWAIERSFEYLLPKGRFPVGVFSLIVPGNHLDVNVHPGKLEVRLNDPRLPSNLTHWLRKILSGGQKMPEDLIGQGSSAEICSSEYQKPFWQIHEKPSALQTQYTFETMTLDKAFSFSGSTSELSLGEFVPSKTDNEYLPNLSNELHNFHFGPNLSFRVLGQLNQTFILAETKVGLMIVDQHVAHERVLYEALCKEHPTDEITGQMLLAPITMELNAYEEALVVKHILTLGELGLTLERFGPRVYLLRSVPSGQDNMTPDAFKDLLQELEEHGGTNNLKKAKEALLIMMSCKGAVKAHQSLTLTEMETLMHQLQQTEHPMTCPHGRPIIHLVSYERLLRAFGRT